MTKNLIKKGSVAIYNYLVEKTSESGYRVTLFGLLMIINFPLFGILWKYQNFKFDQEFYLRLIATVLCGLLVSHKFWPEKCLKILPLLWYATLIYCLPFFFTYLTLLNNGATLWLMNCMSAIFFLFLVVSALDTVIILIFGISIGFLCFFSTTSIALTYIPGDISPRGLIFTVLAAMTIGALFARNRELSNLSKISRLRLFAGSLAHDLRTPLANIFLQTQAQEKAVEEINNPNTRKILYNSIQKIEDCINGVNQLISMQLNNIQSEKFDTTKFAIYSINILLKQAIEDYPFKSGERDLLDSSLAPDYLVWVDRRGFGNLIWNLLKNAFDFIKDSGKGEIKLWLEEGKDNDNYNYVHIKDTAKGISPDKSSLIFESFYSERSGGAGIGLAYCKLFMKAAGGEISCEGKLAEFSHFILKFPKID